jgi:hypothetical protein
LIWKVKVIVLSEIDHFSIPLLNENIDLLTKCSLVPNPVQIEQDNIVLVEIFFEELPLRDLRQASDSRSLSSPKGSVEAATATLGQIRYAIARSKALISGVRF